jgi:tetratricopeptide (TPR) repeat protein
MALQPTWSQNNDKQLFTEAESYFLYEEFNEALPVYLELKRNHPDNHHLDYKIGRCYLYIPYQRQKAIPHLEKASKHISQDFKGKSIKEKHAPTDAIYYLGRAYHVNNELDEAIRTYEKFISMLDEKKYDPALVRKQIASCQFAKEALGHPVTLEFKNLGNEINDRFAQTNPVISGDGQTLVFTSKLQFYDAIFVSRKSADGWSAPRNIIPELKVDDKTYPTALNFDGNELYLYRLDNYDGNIYVSINKSGTWTPPEKLNDHINTKYWESHASVSKDGHTLYFSSNRPGGFGGLDIYYSHRKNGNNWQKPVNAGNAINSNRNDDTPFMTNDGKRLYFSSLGHQSMGGYDIFYAEKNNTDRWNIPKNMGYPINSTDDDLFFQPFDNGNFGFYSMLKKEGHGLHDIYELDMLVSTEPIHISLIAQLNNTFSDTLKAIILHPQNQKVIYETIVDPGNVQFQTALKPGDYKLIISGKNIRSEQTTFTLDEKYEHDVYTLNLQPELVEKTPQHPNYINKNENELLLDLVRDKIIVDDDGTVRLPVSLSSGALLKVQVTNNDELYEHDSYYLEEDVFTYEFNARAGKSYVLLELSNGNKIKTDSVVIDFEKGPDSQKTENIELSNDIRMLLIDLVEINNHSGLEETLWRLQQAPVRLQNADQLYNYLLRASDTLEFNVSDVNLMMERYVLSLIRYYEQETLKEIFSDKISTESGKITIDDITAAYAQLDNLLFAISRVAREERIEPVRIASYLQEIDDTINGLKLPARSSELAIYEWLESVFNNKKFFETASKARVTAMSLLEVMIISGYLDKLKFVSSGSLQHYFNSLEAENINTVLNLKDTFISSTENGNITWDGLINTLLKVNRQFQTTDTRDAEPLATIHQKTKTNNTKSILLFIIGGVLLIFVIIYYIKRKRKKQTE